MKIELINGSVWQIVGADNFDSLVGSNPVHVTYSEYALMSPKAREYLRPIIAENDGSELFISTPRGYNHFHDLYEFAKTSKLWFCSRLSVHDTGVIPESVLEEEKKTMPEELFRQEFECDFSAANVGAILGRWVEAAEKDGRVNNEVEYDPLGAPLELSSDIGFRDTAVFWFWQPRADGFALVDYMHGSGMDAPEWVDEIKKNSQNQGYRIGKIWLPHDAKAKTFATQHSAMETFLKGFGADVVRVVPQTKKLDKINAARAVMPRAWFNSEKCADGLKGLRAWAFEWNNDTRQFSRDPKHDWACFHPDTKVLTRYGTYRIMDLPQNGEVLTPCGWKPYQGPKITRKNARLVEVTFKNGHTVKCTPDHMFLTDSGWKYAESLRPGSLIRSSLTQSRSISMAVCTVYGRARNTLLAAVKNCIDAFGNWHLGQFQTVATSITAMETHKTTTCPILNAWTLPSTFRKGLVKETLKHRMPLPSQPEIRPANGTNQKPDYCGIADKAKTSKIGQNGTVLINRVLNAGRYLKRLIDLDLRLKNSAPTFAESLIIESVLPIPEIHDTWCIHVPDGHWFTLENGAVVHNSHPGDGFAEGALMMKERVREVREAKVNRDVMAAEDGGLFQLPALDELWKSARPATVRY